MLYIKFPVQYCQANQNLLKIVEGICMFKKHKKLISLATVFCFLFNVMVIYPQLAFASAKKDAPDQVIEKQELVSERTAYSKRYANPDGTITEEIYSTPIHYRGTQGNWLSIDNNLAPVPDNNFEFANKDNKVKFLFGKNTRSQSLVRFQAKNKWVDFRPVAASVYGTEIQQDNDVVNDVYGTIAEDTITYPNIFNNTSIAYKSCSQSLKESIILQQPTFNYFSFEIKLHKLNLLRSETGQLLLTDPESDATVAYFVTPYMQDDKGATSQAVSLSLREENDKTYMDLLADSSWLSSQERVFPVVIDPTIVLYDELDDTYVSSANPNTGYAGSNYLYAGNKAGFGTTRSFMSFILPSLPSSARIDQAYISVYQYLRSPPATTLNVYPQTQPWSSWSTRTWNTQPSVGSLAGTTTGNSTGYWNITITDLVKDWYNGVLANYGISLRLDNETQTALEFYSKEQGSNVPKLTITYTVDPIGQENFWTFSQDGVNMASGNLAFQKTDVSIPGRGEWTEFTRTYNSRSSYSGLTGYGWTSNWEIRLKVPPNGYGPITLVDADGTEHIFARRTDGNYTPPDGVYLQLVKNTDNTYTITGTDGTKNNFTSTGKLFSIVDTNGNTLSLNYDTNGQLQSVADASGRSTALTYHSGGKLWKMTDMANRVVEFGYDVNGNLTLVTDQAGKQTTYSYDSNHNLTAVTDPKGNKVNYNHDPTGDKVASSSKIITINGVPQTGTTTFQYFSGPRTTVTDAKGHVVTYDYNAYCNVTNISEDPSGLNHRTTYEYDTDNNLSRITDANTNAGINTGTYDYTWDTSGSLLTETNPLSQQSGYTYDSRNNLVLTTDPNNNSISFSYDAKNNNTEITDPYRQTAATWYDLYGNTTSQTNVLPANSNILVNQSFERDANADNWPDDWNKVTEPGKNATFGWSTVALSGARSVSIVNPTGWAYVATAQLYPIDSAKSYVLSTYVKADNLTSSAKLKVDACNSSGSALGQLESEPLSGTHDWTRLAIFITSDKLPAGTTQLKVNLGIYGSATGTAYFDDVQLEEVASLTTYSLVENSGFEKYTGNLPHNWSGGNLGAYDTVTTSNFYAGTASFKFQGASGVNKYLKHRVSLSGNQNSSYTVSGWSKAESASSSGGSYALEARVNYTDGTIGYFTNHVTKGTHDWEHIVATVQPVKAFNSIDIYCLYYNQAGYAYFDAIRFQEGKSITTFEYDSNKNYLTRSTNPLGYQANSSYDPVGNVTSVTDARNYTTTYSYNALNRLQSVTDPNNKVTAYGYDDNGNLASVTDANNHTTNYQHNEFDLLKSATDPLNRATSYGYDLVGNLSKILYPNGNAVEYGYNSVNRQVSISENSTQKWSFQYDPNGNRTRMTDIINSRDTTSTYNSANQLSLVSYPRGNQVSYNYDQAGNITGLMTTINSNNYTHNFTYDKLNQNIKVSSPNSTVEYLFDENGNIARVRKGNGSYAIQQYNSNGKIILLRNYAPNGNILSGFSYSYDANGNCTSIVYTRRNHPVPVRRPKPAHQGKLSGRESH